MRWHYTLAPLAAILAAGGCSSTHIHGDPATAVEAVAETAPVDTANTDAADDPAIWANPDDPSAGLVVATDKKGGLYVYGLDGSQKSFLPVARVNNVDLAAVDDGRVIVVASDREDKAHASLQLFALDTATAQLQPIGVAPGGEGEGYGLCLYKTESGEILAYSVLKSGTIHEVALNISNPAKSQMRRELVLKTQAEGCVADPRNGNLYVGEEDVGIWRFAPGEITGTLVAPVDNKMLVADVEGLAIAPQGKDGGYVIASSQGDNTYPVYRLPGMKPVGRFRIAKGTFGATEETDGIDLSLADFGPTFPGGLFIAQDGVNPPLAQNFKFVPWKSVEQALGL